MFYSLIAYFMRGLAFHVEQNLRGLFKAFLEKNRKAFIKAEYKN